MPKAYEKMRDKFASKDKMPLKAANQGGEDLQRQTQAGVKPVTGKSE